MSNVAVIGKSELDIPTGRGGDGSGSKAVGDSGGEGETDPKAEW